MGLFGLIQLALLTLGFAALGIAPIALAPKKLQSQSASIAEVDAITGSVRRKPEAMLSFFSVSPGSPLFSRDGVKVEAKSRAGITFRNGASLTLEENTYVVLDPFSPDGFVLVSGVATFSRRAIAGLPARSGLIAPQTLAETRHVRKEANPIIDALKNSDDSEGSDSKTDADASSETTLASRAPSGRSTSSEPRDPTPRPSSQEEGGPPRAADSDDKTDPADVDSLGPEAQPEPPSDLPDAVHLSGIQDERGLRLSWQSKINPAAISRWLVTIATRTGETQQVLFEVGATSNSAYIPSVNLSSGRRYQVIGQGLDGSTKAVSGLFIHTISTPPAPQLLVASFALGYVSWALTSPGRDKIFVLWESPTSPTRFVVEYQQGSGPVIARLVDGSHRFTAIDAMFVDHVPNLSVRVYAEIASGGGHHLRSTSSSNAKFCMGDMDNNGVIDTRDLSQIERSYSVPAPGSWRYSGLYFDTPLENVDWSPAIDVIDKNFVAKRFLGSSCVGNATN